MKNKILFVLCLLTGMMFINAGLDKFFHYMPMPKEMPEKMVKTMGAFQQIGWLIPLVGVAELLGGLLLILPKTRALGAVVLVPILAGILLTNITMASSGLPIAIALVAIVIWVIIENREKHLPMIRK
jgi:uncharacterized membrane protein YphA (DoxX/SURF4 family)